MSSNSNSNSASYSYSSSSFTSSSSSTSRSGPGGTGTGTTTTRYTQQMHSNDRDGTTVRRTHEETGKPTIEESRHFPASGRAVNGSERSRIEDVTDEDEEQAKRDKEYEERMEDEYAKREGGA